MVVFIIDEITDRDSRQGTIKFSSALQASGCHFHLPTAPN